jgi:hypothetical protein
VGETSMNILSYIEDKNILSSCVENRDYSKVNNIVDGMKESLTHYITYDDSLLGYKIYKVESLSKLYNFNVYAINFYFTNITHEFNNYHSEKIGELIVHLKEILKEMNGYFIIKIPSANSMLINEINKSKINFIFAGGTICYYTTKINERIFENTELAIRVASNEDKVKYRSDLITLGRESFEEYFGQYHISYVTRDKAPLIYENWIEEYLDHSDDNLIIALIDNKVVGFLTIDVTEEAVELVLSGINNNYRNLKIYERIIRYGTQFALDHNKIATLSTQFDNFFVQRAWINIGYKPYYSFYLYHLNNIFQPNLETYINID